MSFICFGLATSSEKWGVGSGDYGKYAVKLYTIDGVLIYQVDNGGTNSDKAPLGGVIYQSSAASSMTTIITNPITFYGSGAVINQAGHSGDLYNYYWTSYSRGTDGRDGAGGSKWHNAYLDGYIPLRVKSIYDPCPYLYRIPSHGTFNQFTDTGWTPWSYLGGVRCNINTLGESWFVGSGWRTGWSNVFEFVGGVGFYRSSTIGNQTNGYTLAFDSGRWITSNQNDYARSYGQSVRCIEGTGRYAHTFCQQKVCKNCRAS